MNSDPELIISNTFDENPREWDSMKLVDIRCPRERYFPKYKQMMICNYKCTEAFPGSSGRAYCFRCREFSNGLFWFEVSNDYIKPKPKRVIQATQDKPTPK